MAGVNLETKLSRLFKPESLTRRASAYGYALINGAGTWLVLLGSMMLLRWVMLATEWTSVTTANLFATAVAYCFIFGQLINATGQFAASRFVADELYAGRADRLLPALIGWLKLQLVLAVAAAGAYWLVFQPQWWFALLLFTGLAATITLFSVNLFVAQVAKRQLTLYWLAAGMGVAIIFALLCGANQWWLPVLHGPMVTLLVGFAAGLMVAIGGLMSTLLRRVPIGHRRDQYALLLAIDTNKPLLLAGIGYAAGLWSANLIYWLTSGTTLSGLFQVNLVYDTSTFWAYLLITPVYMLLFLAIETRFHPYYRKLMSQINNGGTLAAIEKSQAKLRSVLIQELQRIFRTQGILTLIVVALIGIASSQSLYFSLETSVLQLVIVGACLNSFVLVILLMQMYLDDQRGAAATGTVFGGGVILATLLGLPLDMSFYGLGLVIGALLGVVAGLPRLLSYTEHLSTHLFLKQTGSQPGWLGEIALAYARRHQD